MMMPVRWLYRCWVGGSHAHVDTHTQETQGRRETRGGRENTRNTRSHSWSHATLWCSALSVCITTSWSCKGNIVVCSFPYVFFIFTHMKSNTGFFPEKEETPHRHSVQHMKKIELGISLGTVMDTFAYFLSVIYLQFSSEKNVNYYLYQPCLFCGWVSTTCLKRKHVYEESFRET